MVTKRACAGVIIAAALLFLVGGTVTADIYKWIDQNGTIHFSDEPPASGSRTQLEQMPSAPPSAEAPAEARPTQQADIVPPKSPPAEKPTGDKPDRPKIVELYVTSWCKYCSLARNYLRARNIPFMEYDIEKDKEAARRRYALEKRPGVPLAVINNTIVLGFSEAAYARALNLP